MESLVLHPFSHDDAGTARGRPDAEGLAGHRRTGGGNSVLEFLSVERDPVVCHPNTDS